MYFEILSLIIILSLFQKTLFSLSPFFSLLSVIASAIVNQPISSKIFHSIRALDPWLQQHLQKHHSPPTLLQFMQLLRTTTNQSPLPLLSNMSNLMQIKLHYTNYIPWKHQLITIVEAYSLIEHIDVTASKPSPFVLNASRNPTSVVIPEFQSWKIKDKALLSLINSTLNSTGFLACCQYHKLKRSLEHSGREVHIHIKRKNPQS